MVLNENMVENMVLNEKITKNKGEWPKRTSDESKLSSIMLSLRSS